MYRLHILKALPKMPRAMHLVGIEETRAKKWLVCALDDGTNQP